uniref:uncharacterized protein n=1 Tax=Myxine glutinosa TaxID=7769 RepID=UPI00358F77DC
MNYYAEKELDNFDIPWSPTTCVELNLQIDELDSNLLSMEEIVSEIQNENTTFATTWGEMMIDLFEDLLNNQDPQNEFYLDDPAKELYLGDSLNLGKTNYEVCRDGSNCGAYLGDSLNLGKTNYEVCRDGSNCGAYLGDSLNLGKTNYEVCRDGSNCGAYLGDSLNLGKTNYEVCRDGSNCGAYLGDSLNFIKLGKEFYLGDFENWFRFGDSSCVELNLHLDKLDSNFSSMKEIVSEIQNENTTFATTWGEMIDLFKDLLSNHDQENEFCLDNPTKEFYLGGSLDSKAMNNVLSLMTFDLSNIKKVQRRRCWKILSSHFYFFQLESLERQNWRKRKNIYFEIRIKKHFKKILKYVFKKRKGKKDYARVRLLALLNKKQCQYFYFI